MANEREITIKLAAKNLTAAEFAKARAEILGLGDASDKASRSGGGLSSMFKTAAGSMAGFVGGAALLGAVRSGFDFVVGGAIDMNATLEKSTLQFGTLMGDADKAQAHVKGLFEFAKKTPFETGPIINASLKLQTFGGEALNTMDNLTLLGDASAATGAPIEDLGFWVGRLYASLKGGQPFGESAMRLQELAVLTPAARAEMEAMQKAGKSAEEIFAVFQGRLGEFGGAMVAQANTWEGLKSSISDAVNIMMAESLKPLFDLVKTGAQVVLTALGSDGMEKAFTAVKDTMQATLGGNADGGVGLVKTFINGLLTGVDAGLMALGFFGQGWGAIKVVLQGFATVALTTIGAVINGFASLVSAAERIPGIGDKFKGASESVKWAADAVNIMRDEFAQLTAESAKSAAGQDGFATAIAGARTIVQSIQAEVSKATVVTGEHTTATKAATAAKGEFVAQTKAEIATEKERQKLLEKGRDYVAGVLLDERLRRISGEDLRKVIAAGNVEIGNEIAGLGQVRTSYIGVLESSTALASAMGGPFRAAVASTTAELTKLHNAGNSVKTSLSNAMKDLPNVIMGALQGGGNVGKSIGASIFGNMFSADSGLTKTITAGASKLLGAGLGSAIGSVVPGLGTLLGSQLGVVAEKAFGKIFKSEGKKVNDMRDGFVSAAGGIHELNVKAQAAGLTLDRLLKAKNVKDYQAAVEELNAAFGKSEADMELARQAMEEWGISSEEAGQKFAQADMDKRAGDMLAKLKAATAAGVDLNAIVAKGGDDFGSMVHQAIRSGTTISNEFRPVLAAMIANKSLVDENGEAFTDLSQIPFADDIGGGLKEVATSLKELAAYFMGGMSNAFKGAGDKGVDFANRVNAGINGIPRRIEIEVNGTYNPPEIDGSGPGYAIGTKGRHGSYFVNFGARTNADLHGYEAVITPEQTPDFVAEYLASLGGGGRAAAPSASPNVYVLVEMDAQGRAQRTSAISEREYLRREMQQLLRSNAVTVPSTAVGVV